MPTELEFPIPGTHLINFYMFWKTKLKIFRLVGVDVAAKPASVAARAGLVIKNCIANTIGILFNILRIV